ncbi:hypothetical protein GCM10010124_22890 [Pilimelia terevasa]|uniref:Uncharacterized protein n=1 Tax=Pilimelia terevasa TaxID=53372 RepID=A0A8J3BL70_9ACTN|nr:hypothetical protein [Pilimelia terevasa]GGK29589.1 hypothetical protein GCM10010124_22890 [Pilimelia terevasa]
MPPAVKTVRTMLWFQCGLYLLGLMLALVALFALGDAGASPAPAIGLAVVAALTTGLLAFLASRVPGRAPWVFWAVLGVELFVIVDRVVGVATGGGPAGLIGALLAVVVVVKLAGAEGRAWFRPAARAGAAGDGAV